MCICVCVCVCVCVKCICTLKSFNSKHRLPWYYGLNKNAQPKTWGKESESVRHSVVSNSLPYHGLQPSRLLCPWSSPCKILECVAISTPGDLPHPGIELSHFIHFIWWTFWGLQAQEAASQIALRHGSEEVGKEPGYIGVLATKTR